MRSRGEMHSGECRTSWGLTNSVVVNVTLWEMKFIVVLMSCILDKIWNCILVLFMDNLQFAESV